MIFLHYGYLKLARGGEDKYKRLDLFTFSKQNQSKLSAGSIYTLRTYYVVVAEILFGQINTLFTRLGSYSLP